MAVSADSAPTQVGKPEAFAAHEEKANTDHSVNDGLDHEIQAYEARKIDLRTILGLLVRTQVPATEPTNLEQSLAVTYECCLFSFVLPGVILLTINQDIGPSNNIAWVATSWALASAVVMIVAGRLSDIFGRRNFFLGGNLLGIVGCAIACRATNVSVLILGSSILVSPALLFISPNID